MTLKIVSILFNEKVSLSCIGYINIYFSSIIFNENIIILCLENPQTHSLVSVHHNLKVFFLHLNKKIYCKATNYYIPKQYRVTCFI